MPRTAEPRYWEQRRLWYVMVRRPGDKTARRHVLYRLRPGEAKAKTKDAAYKAYVELAETLKRDGQWSPAPGERMGLATFGKLYSAHVEKTMARSTFEVYSLAVRRFAERYPNAAAEDIKIKDVEDYVASRPWNGNTRANQIAILRSWWAWGESAGHLPSNPLRKLKIPPSVVRAKIPTQEEGKRLLAASMPGWFRDAIEVIYYTGCRPSEVYRMTAAHVDLEARCWRLHGKTTKRTGRMREVYFPTRIRQILSRLMKRHPTGPLFRNSAGGTLCNSAMAHHMKKIRAEAKLPAHVTVGSLRHLFATDLLQQGTPPATVAALLGHTSINMVMRTYGRLIDRKDHLKEALDKARGDQ